MEMMIHKTGRKLNRVGYPKATSQFRRIVGAACMVAVLAGTGGFRLSVQAAPATLKSPDATVYEQANEESNAVANLVEGSSFEYIGDVTAEDSSVWHQVTTANGAAGYIRGDRELEIREEEPAPENQEGENEPDGQDAPTEDGVDTAPAENEPEGDAGAGENPEEVAGRAEEDAAEDGEDEETPEEDDGERVEDNDALAAVINMRNDQSKKYVMDTSAKVKERGSFAEINTGILNEKSKISGIDRTLIIGIAVMFFCIGTVIFCLSRMKRLKWETDVEETLDSGRSRIQRKIEKKKRSLKRKGKKATRGRQENLKPPNIKIK